MKTKHSEISSDTYFGLVRQFPLRRLKTSAEHRGAVKFLTKVSLAHPGTRDRGILDYLDMLAGIIDAYEVSARQKIDLSHVEPAALIRQLIAEHGTSISALAKEIGIAQSNLSEMLSSRRDFSKTAIQRLCERFGLSPAVFFRGLGAKL